MGYKTDDEVVQRLAEQVRAIRKRRGHTQEHLGELAGLHPETVSRVETAKMQPSLAVVRALAVALGVRIGDLVETESAAEELLLARDEAELLEVWRKLDMEARSCFLTLLQRM